MPNVYIIMGGSKTRKSATIMALTGALRPKVYAIATNNQDINVFIKTTRSLQERKIPPIEFINEINSNNYDNVLLALRVNRCNRQDNGLGYIQEFINANWNIRNIFVLGTSTLPYRLPVQSPTPNFIANSRTLPANRIAYNLRGILSWL